MAQDPTWIALIRAIGGATHATLPMARLRAAASAAGLDAPQTVLATGNLIFRSSRPEADLHALLTEVLRSHGLGPAQEVFLRTPQALRDALAANPFPDAASDRPSRLLVHLLHTRPAPERAAAVEAWDGPELCRVVDRALFIDFRDGIGTSRLTPAVLERLLQQRGTARNWNTMGRVLAACPAGS